MSLAPALRRTDPWLAVGLSVLMPGLGHLSLGHSQRGAAFFLAWAGAGGVCLLWILSDFWSAPLAGGAIYLALFGAEVGSWVDAYRLGWQGRPRRLRRRFRPAKAAALSVLLPGLGHLYLLLLRPNSAAFFGSVLLVGSGVVFAGGAFEAAPIPGWPVWLMGWPLWLAASLGALISAFAIPHAYVLAFRQAGRRARWPRMSGALLAVTLAVWLAGVMPWLGWFKTRVRSFRIPSLSMAPTLEVGDRIWAKREASLSRGDIVVFRLPLEPETDYVKRIVGLPGDSVAISGNQVWVNGRPLSEPYAKWIQEAGDFGPVTVPGGSLFLLGDNRSFSRDSRFFGFVPRENVFGRAYKRYWPPRRSGPLRGPMDGE